MNLKLRRLIVAAALVLFAGVACAAGWYPAPAGNQQAQPVFSVDPLTGLPVVGGLVTSPATRTLVQLDVAAVTTGGAAVTALAAGHRSAGGWLYNPSTATVALCINEVATASGTTSQGNLTCIPPDRTYNLTPGAGAVSVVSSDSAHPFSGFGFN